MRDIAIQGREPLDRGFVLDGVQAGCTGGLDRIVRNADTAKDTEVWGGKASRIYVEQDKRGFTF